MKSTANRIQGFVISITITLFTGALLAAEATNTTSDVRAAPSGAGTLLDHLSEPVAKEERELHSLFLDLQQKKNAATWELLKSKKVSYINLSRAISSALKKNLSLRVSQANQELASRAIEEAEALFDPRLLVSFGYQETETFRRTVTGTVVLKKFTPLVSQDLAFIPTDEPQIQSVTFRWQVDEEVVTKEILVSDEQPNGPEKEKQYTVGIDQQLPWGATMGLDFFTTDKEVYYNIRGDSYGANFASTLALNLDTALPGTSGFGELAEAEAAALRAKENEQQARWQVKVAINSILLEVDAAFWNLVETLQALSVAEENYALVSEQVQRGSRLFKSGRINNYSKALVESEFARAKANRETARKNYLLASNTMALMMDEDDSVIRDYIHLPYGFSSDLNSVMQFSLSAAVATAQKQRPEILLDEAGVRVAALNQRIAKNRLRPDVRFTADYQLAQNGDVYGYKSEFESISNIMDPDSRAYGYGLSYRYPVLNRKLGASVDTAAINKTDVGLSKKDRQNTAVREVRDALAQLNNAERVLSFAIARQGYAKEAYKRLNKKRKISGDIKEDELIDSMRELNQARQDVVLQKVARKRAESALLYAQGMLEKRFVANAANSGFERKRLESLAKYGNFTMFRPN